VEKTIVRARLATFTVVSVSLLNACASLEPIKLPSADDYPTVLKSVEDRIGVYNTYAAKLEDWKVPYNVGITLLAAGSVAAAVFSHGAARGNILAGIGIGAGTASILWNSYRTDDKGVAYELAAYRGECLLLKGRRLSGPTVDAQASALIKDVETLTSDIDLVQKGVDTLLPKADTVPRRGVVADAQIALPVARAARATGLQEQDAFASRGIEVQQALLTIDTAAEQGSRTLVVNFNAAKQEINGAVNAAPAPQTPSPGGGPQKAAGADLKKETAEQILFDQLANQTKSMSALAAVVSANKPFTPRIDDIHACIVLTGVKDSGSAGK
jgi:hypothetical protein